MSAAQDNGWGGCARDELSRARRIDPVFTEPDRS